MINLLPSSIKQERKYARHNRKLVMWLSISALGIAALFIISAGGFVLLQQAISNAEENNTALTETLAAQQVDSQIAEFKDFSDDLSTVTSILDQQYLFSNLVQRIGGTLPPQSVLSGISLTGEDLTLTLAFDAIDTTTANQILANLNDKQNGLFEQADTLSISCRAPDPTVANDLPCATSLKVLFFEDSDFVLLNGLLTEQALADALDNLLTSGLATDRIATEQVRLDGLQDTFNVSILSDTASLGSSAIERLRSTQFTYETTLEDNSTVELSTPYFLSVTQQEQNCPGSIANPIDSTDTFSCRTILELTFNINPSDEEIKEEEKEQNGIDSLESDFVETYRTVSEER